MYPSRHPVRCAMATERTRYLHIRLPLSLIAAADCRAAELGMDGRSAYVRWLLREHTRGRRPMGGGMATYESCYRIGDEVKVCIGTAAEFASGGHSNIPGRIRRVSFTDEGKVLYDVQPS